MSLQGPMVVVADNPAPDLVEELGAAGAFPVVESRWADAPSAFISVQPSAIVLAEPGPASDRKAAIRLGCRSRPAAAPSFPSLAAPAAMPASQFRAACPSM